MKHIIYKDDKMLGSYLAGLWEGDGNIIVRKSLNNTPGFNISFNIKNAPLAYKLLQILEAKRGQGKIGTIRCREERNCCILQIYSIDGLTYIVNLLNGRLRTPKAYQIGIIINWLNKQHDGEILHLSKNNIDIFFTY